MKYLTLLIFFFCSHSLWARLFLDISVESKKGIDSELTLGSELHSTEEVSSKKDIVLKLKSGLKVSLRAEFAENDKALIGPVDRIRITGKVFDTNGDKIKDFLKGPFVLVLGEKKLLSHSLKGEKIDITILPYMK